MADFRLEAEIRTEFGKGGARRTRRAGRVPAVLYGHGQDVVHLSLPAREFAAALRNGGSNVLLTVVLDGKEQLALTKAVQRDPLTRQHKHADLLVVRRGEKVKVDVAVHVIGDAVPDALVNTELNALEVMAEATHIPTGFDVDISGRPIGSQILAKEIVLPAGVELVTDPEQLVVNITAAQTAEALEEELASAEADAGIERDEPETPAEGGGEGDAAETAE